MDHTISIHVLGNGAMNDCLILEMLRRMSQLKVIRMLFFSFALLLLFTIYHISPVCKCFLQDLNILWNTLFQRCNTNINILSDH